MPDHSFAESVFTLDDLKNWSRPGVNLAVLGHPIKHSISPAMHNAALARMRETEPRFATWSYFRFEIPPADLPLALDLLHAKQFLGVNLTVPHKILAFDRIAEIDPAAQPIGAVNTLKNTPAGWHGFNTDGYGLAAGLREDLSLDLATQPVILLGAGGAARGAAVEILQRGCSSLWIGNRTRANLEALLDQLRPVAASNHTPVHGFDPSHPPVHIPPNALVINATSAGLNPGDSTPLDLAVLTSPAGVYDMIYNPAETPLLARARLLGLPAANGLSMLVHQGVRALEIWSETEVPVDAMRSAARAAMQR